MRSFAAAALALVLTQSVLAAEPYELVVAGYEMPCGPLAPPPAPAAEWHPYGEMELGVLAVAAAPGGRLYGLTLDAVVEVVRGATPRIIYKFESRPWNLQALVVDRAGRIYVHGHSALYAIDADGTLRATYPLIGHYGDGIASGLLDLAADRCTLYLIKDEVIVQRFDVCTGRFGETFAVLPGGALMPPGALRVLPDGGLLIARGQELLRYASDGTYVRTYHYPRPASIEAVGLSAGGGRAWLVAGECEFDLVELDLTTGAVLSSRFNDIEAPHAVVAADAWTAAIDVPAGRRRRAVAVHGR